MVPGVQAVRAAERFQTFQRNNGAHHIDAVFTDLEADLCASSERHRPLPVITEAAALAAVWLRIALGVALGLAIGA